MEPAAPTICRNCSRAVAPTAELAAATIPRATLDALPAEDLPRALRTNRQIALEEGGLCGVCAEAATKTAPPAIHSTVTPSPREAQRLRAGLEGLIRQTHAVGVAEGDRLCLALAGLPPPPDLTQPEPPTPAPSCKGCGAATRAEEEVIEALRTLIAELRGFCARCASPPAEPQDQDPLADVFGRAVAWREGKEDEGTAKLDRDTLVFCGKAVVEGFMGLLAEIAAVGRASLLFGPSTVAYLTLLCSPAGHKTVREVIGHLVHTAADGVSRPGSWERAWVTQAFGDAWASALSQAPPEPDADAAPATAEGAAGGMR